MKAQKKLTELAESALSQIDALGFRLDAIGVDNQINRHNLIALLMFGQKRLEGEMDSFNAKVDVSKAKVEGIITNTEKLIISAKDLAFFPAQYTIDRIKAQF